MKYVLQICLLLVAALFAFREATATSPVKIILDTDMAGDCDDAGALAVLHSLADLGEAEILAVVTNRKDTANASASAVSAINHWYGRPNILIGTDKDGLKLVEKPSSFTTALRDNFTHSARPDDQMPNALDVYRSTLAAQPDRSIVICSVGALSNLEDLLKSEPDETSELSGIELLSRKVSHTVIMGGSFPRSRVPETNLRLDPPAVVNVINHWPTPIVWSGYEIGAKLTCGAKLKSTPEDNPVRRAYELRPFRKGKAIDRGKTAHDQAAVVVAVRGNSSPYYRTISKGRVVVDSDGHTEWKSDKSKSHSYLALKGAPARFAQIIEELMYALPLGKQEHK